MKTFGELVTDTGQLVQKTTDNYKANVIKPAIRLVLQTLYNKYDYFDSLRGVHNFTTVDGTATYYMPNNFEKPLRFYDITNDKKINVDVEENYFDANIANIADATEGDVNTAYFTEEVGVKVQISTSGDTVQAVGSNSADAGTVRVKGYLDSALTIEGFEDITLNGTSAATATSPLTFYKILGFSKSADTTGYISLKNSSSTTLGVLGPVERVARYKAFRLGLIPDDSATSMRVLYKKKMTPLRDDEDYPFIDADDYIIYKAAAICLQQDKESVERAAVLLQMASEAENGIMLNQMTSLGPDYQQTMISGILTAHRS